MKDNNLLDIMRIIDEKERLREENVILRRGIKGVVRLINQSNGVYGLHLNGAPAPWDELLEGGYHENWLIDFSKAAELVESDKK